MGEKTIIAWTDHTWNPWVGCTKVSPGCDNCYMFTGRSRYGHDPERVSRTSPGKWAEPRRWQRAAEDAGRIERVFTCSWSDWFHVDADPWRGEAWALTQQTPNLIYQILTKRQGRMRSKLPADWRDGYPNIWLGVSVESPEQFYRVDQLRDIPAAVRFLSVEPMLAPLTGVNLDGIDWVIVGGESGPNYRPMAHEWVRDLRDACRDAGVAFFFKQSSAPRTEMGIELDGRIVREYPTPRRLAMSPAMTSLFAGVAR